jgi:hypothetical protein
MPPAPGKSAVLACHPDTRSAAVRSVRVRAASESGSLKISYAIEGDVARLRIPPARLPRIAEKLWRHTCCEIFVARKGMAAYHEFNFSPSGEWAAYSFESYRKAVPLTDETVDPGISVRRSANELALEARVPLPLKEKEKLLLALCVVIEDEDGGLSYWALRHPPGKPDFHHPDAFAMELDEARN